MDNSNNISNDVSNNISTDISNNISNDVSNNISNDVSNNISNDVSNNGTYNETQLMNSINNFINQMDNIFEMSNLNSMYAPRLLPMRPRSLIHYLNTNVTNNPPSMEDIIEQSFNEKSKFKNVVSEEGLEQLEDITYKVDNSGNFEYKSCPITTTDFEEGEILKKLPCGHVYSSEGILMWFKESNKCPLCRYEMPYKEIKDETIKPRSPIRRQSSIQSPRQNSNESDTDETDTDETDPDTIYNTNINRIYNMLNSYRSPYSMLSNRRIMPHSYIQPIMTNRILRDEEEMLQQALMNSLQDTNNDISNNDISNN